MFQDQVQEAVDASPVENYCEGCSKIVDGRCSVYTNPAVKTAIRRGGHIGCALSPCELRYYRDSQGHGRRRVGHQKQRKK